MVVLRAELVARVLVVMVAFMEQRVLQEQPTQARAAAAVWGLRAPAQPTVVRVLLVLSSLGTSVAALAQEAPLARVPAQLRAIPYIHLHLAARFL